MTRRMVIVVVVNHLSIAADEVAMIAVMDSWSLLGSIAIFKNIHQRFENSFTSQTLPW